MAEQLERLEAAISTMRRAHHGGRPSPHKLLMLLAVLDMFDAGAIEENRIPFDPGLIERFTTYFGALADEGDWCQPGPPFFHLRSSGFWKHKPIEGRESEYAALTKVGGGTKRIVDNIEYAYLEEGAFAVFSDSMQRQALRRFILETFFSGADHGKLKEVALREARIDTYESSLEKDTEGARNSDTLDAHTRNAAFSRLIRRVYDYQCAMCGLRIISRDGSTPIEAAHLIPWRESHDDSVSNGIALCKLHHWALDAGLVAPDLKLRWVVSTWLDRRRNSERELTRFHHSAILLPREEQHFPRRDAIQWRLDRLSK